ncbi:MAG TPA: isoprenyl transferase [Candidatus Bacteroides avicola]|uniref:Isoprenyl transferase n=1 Tax=Candidatus Bacteroides avicola TaxID=2838468 RepID=A0A9D2HSM1_9BACE|nr:isoprenyl transferase [Candidatus Bacteroides avicola]
MPEADRRLRTDAPDATNGVGEGKNGRNIKRRDNMSYKEQLDLDRIPAHVAIIMDGNGRWAKQRGRERSYGHQAGAETVHVIAEEAARLGVKYLTLYTFSTENWGRPAEEVTALMGLLFDSIEEETFMKNNIRFRVIGDTEKLPDYVQDRLNACIDHTDCNSGMTLVLALSYSSRWEIAEAGKQLAQAVKEGEVKVEDIDSHVFAQYLATNFMPDPDLLIRTGGELRLSNYLLWQCAYSELYFCDTYWPDFREEEFCKALCDFQKRERRFGKTSEQIV